MSQELWRVALNAYHSPEYGTSPKVIWQRVVDAISKELLREDEPVMWRIANICGDHFVFETACDEEEADAISSLLGEYWGGTDKLYLRPAPKVSAGWQPIESAPKDGIEIIGYCHGDIRICSWEELNNPVAKHWGIDGTWHRRNIRSGKELMGGSFSPTHWMPLPAAPKGETE